MRFTTLTTGVVKTVVKTNGRNAFYNRFVKAKPTTVVILVLLLSVLACRMPDLNFPTTPAPTTITTVTTNTTITPSPTPEFTTVTTPFTTVFCIVKTGIPSGNLNLRKDAGTGYKVLITLHEGDKLEYLDQEKDGWKKVKLSDDYTGWVNSNYVDCENTD